jgi:hypothetical protein
MIYPPHSGISAGFEGETYQAAAGLILHVDDGAVTIIPDPLGCCAALAARAHWGGLGTKRQHTPRQRCAQNNTGNQGHGDGENRSRSQCDNAETNQSENTKILHLDNPFTIPRWAFS